MIRERQVERGMTEEEAIAEMRSGWPDLFAAAEKRIATIVNKHTCRVSP